MLRTVPNVVSTHGNYYQRGMQTSRDHFILFRIQHGCRKEFLDKIPFCSVLSLYKICPLLVHLLSYLLFNNVLHMMYFDQYPFPNQPLLSHSYLHQIPSSQHQLNTELNNRYFTLGSTIGIFHWAQQDRPCTELNNTYQAQQHTPSAISLWKPTSSPLSFHQHDSCAVFQPHRIFTS